MTEWNILAADGLAESGQEILRQAANLDMLTGISSEDLLEKIDRYDALIVRSRSRVDAALIAAAPRLKVIGRAGVGVDSIDLQAAAAAGIIVVNSPMATTITVAEHTLALILSMARMIPRADASMKAGQWAKKELRGAELYDKTLGIVGMGRIGGAVAQRAGAFRMDVIGYDPLLSDEDIAANGGEPVGLDELYARADFISLHVPLNEQTRGMIDRDAIAKMKDGVRLVCAARGGVIDETALLENLESGRIAGAGLDVFAVEPPGRTALVQHPNVVASPHIGAQTIEAQERTGEHIATEVLAALRGESLRWQVA